MDESASHQAEPVPGQEVKPKDNTKLPRVVFFNRRFHSIYGAQANIIRLARCYQEIGGDVAMLTTAEGIYQQSCHENGLPCQIVPAPSQLLIFGGAVLKFNLFQKLAMAIPIARMNVRLWWTVRKYKPCVLISADAQAAPLLLGSSLVGRIPVGIYVQGDDTGPRLRAIVSFVSKRIFLIADALRADFSRGLFSRPAKLRTLYSGFPIPDRYREAEVRNGFLAEFTLPSDALLVGLVGSICYRKGADLLVAAAAEVLDRFPTTYFVLFGDSPPGHEEFLTELQTVIQQFGLEERFLYPGFRTQREIFNSIDLLVLPSRSEGLPSVLIEALCYGIPVVGTDIAGTKEIIVSEQYGELIPPDNAKALAVAIKNQLSLLGASASAAAAARRCLTIAKFSEQAYVRAFATVAQEMLGT